MGILVQSVSRFPFSLYAFIMVALIMVYYRIAWMFKLFFGVFVSARYDVLFWRSLVYFKSLSRYIFKMRQLLRFHFASFFECGQYSKRKYLVQEEKFISFNPFFSGNTLKGYRETVQTQIRRHIMWNLIRVFSNC